MIRTKNPGLLHVIKRCALCVLMLTPAVLACDGVAAEEPLRFPTGNTGPARLQYVHGLPLVELEGTPAQIGQQHAKLFGDSLVPLLQFPKIVVAKHGGAQAWPLVTGMGRLLLRNAPERYRDELQAFIKQGNYDDGLATVANTLLELRRMGGCAAVIVDDKHTNVDGPLFGRLFDFPSFGVLHKYGVITVVRPEGKHAFASVGFPGMVGVVSGMNDAGLAVATLDVYRCADDSPVFDPLGVPMTLTYRQVLEDCTTVAEAEALLKTIKHTTWMNLAVCDRNTSAVFELTTRGVSVRKGAEGVVCCTNHFRSEELCVDGRCYRFDRLEKLRGQQKVGYAEVAKMLDNVNQGQFTIHSMIFEPRALRLHVAMGAGPITKAPLKAIDLKPLFTRKSIDKPAAVETPVSTDKPVNTAETVEAR